MQSITSRCAVSLTIAVGAAAAGTGPAPVVPQATDLFGGPFLAPGPFPASMTSGTFHARHRWEDIAIFNGTPGVTQAPRELLLLAVGQLDSYNWVDPSIVGTGPSPMTTIWFNAGDNDLNIAPANAATDPFAFPGSIWDEFLPQWDFRLYNPGNLSGGFNPGVILDFDAPALTPGDPAFDPFLAAIAAPANMAVGGTGGGGVFSGGFGQGGAPNYSWIPNAATGVLAVSVASNGVDHGYLLSNLPVGNVRAHAHASISRGGGRGYSMLTGQYRDGGGGPGAIFASMNYLTFPISLEAVIDHSAFWFPYSEGWLGGWVAGNDPDAGFTVVSEDPVTAVAAHPALDADTATWTNFDASEGRIELPGFTPDQGMLFMSSSDNSDSVANANPENPGDFDAGKIIGIIPDDTGWDFTIRYANGLDSSGGLNDRPRPFPPGENAALRNGYSFVFIPYDARGLVAAHVDGDTGSTIASVGDITVTALPNQDPVGFPLNGGYYAVEIPGASDQTGALMLQVTGTIPGGTGPDRAAIDYDWDPEFGQNGAFIVNTFEFRQGGLLGFFTDVRAADFYVAYVGFAEGIAPPAQNCNAADVAAEFGVLNVNDVVEFVNAFNAGDTLADVSPFPGGDGLLNVNDIVDFVNAFNAGCP